MIGHHTRFRENGDLRRLRGSAAKKKPPLFNARALMTRKIIRSRDAQCNTGELEYNKRFSYHWSLSQFQRNEMSI